MKFIILIFINFLSLQLFAAEINKIQISRTFSVDMPFKLSTKVELPSLNSKLFRVLDEKISPITSQILIVHNKPKTFANKFSVERYWKTSREQTKPYDKKETDHGCIRSTARAYQCSRDVAQDGKFLSETIYWNTKNDLVLIRVSSMNSFTDSRKLLEKIKIVQNSRLPAGASK
jgi:hypothetical protein